MKTVAKPLLAGQFEFVSADLPDGKKVTAAEALRGNKDVVWERMYLIYAGDRLTSGTQRLELEKGKYRACEVSVTVPIVWTAKGYTISVNAEAFGRATTFKKLTAKEVSLDARDCKFSVDPDTLDVIAGDSPALRADDGTVVHLRKFDDDLDDFDWRKHVAKK